MCDMIKFINTISTAEFCKLRESAGFQKLTIKQAETVRSNRNDLIEILRFDPIFPYSLTSFLRLFMSATTSI